MLGAETRIADVTHGGLAKLVTAHPWASPKSCNDALIVLRGTCQLAVRDKICDYAADGIKNRAVPK